MGTDSDLVLKSPILQTALVACRAFVRDPERSLDESEKGDELM